MLPDPAKLGPGRLKQRVSSLFKLCFDSEWQPCRKLRRRMAIGPVACVCTSARLHFGQQLRRAEIEIKAFGPGDPRDKSREGREERLRLFLVHPRTGGGR